MESIEDNNLPYFKTVPISPDGGELSYENRKRKLKNTKSKEKKLTPESVKDDEEARLRKRLLEKQEKKVKISEEIKKYSKFDSSPEIVEDEDDIVENEFDYESDNNEIETDDFLQDVSLEDRDFDELTEEERLKIPPDTLKIMEEKHQKHLNSQLPIYYPGISGCRKIDEFENLNKIEEGTYGIVYRALEKRTDEIVALKRLKMEKEKEGFPITSLREINMLLKCGSHPNIVNVKEIVVGSCMDKIYLVMEYVEHDIKSLMELMLSKNKSFTLAQVKTLMKQLISGVEHMHKEYVIHRDLKTSNLLFSHNGVLKIGDFGLAREFGEPLKPYTPIVVTLWYRSPELLLGIKEYSMAVDMWSVGCIFAEFLKLKPLFQGRSEVDQLNKIFKEIGTPNEQIWPGYSELPGVKRFAFADIPYNQLRKKFVSEIPTDIGFELLNRLLAPCPDRRILATNALLSPWFTEEPLPAAPEMFPTFPAKSEQNKKPAGRNMDLGKPKPNAPILSAEKMQLLSDLKLDMNKVSGDGFSLRFDAPKF